MKNLLLASVGLLALGVSGASAADLPQKAPVMQQTYLQPVPVYNWTGAYVGINGGGGWGNSSFGGPLATGSFRTSGGLIGGTLGYNWQMGPLVTGIEGDLDWTNLRGSTGCITACETRNSWLGTVRGRFGYAFDNIMPYVTGGLAVGDIRNSVAGFGTSSTTKLGYALGAGVEVGLAGPWTAKLEYMYVDLGRGGSVIGSDSSLRTNIVRAGLNYRF